MAVIFFCGDPHSQFAHIIQSVHDYGPNAVVLLGDITPKRPLEVELADILNLTEVHWICGNHDTDNAENHDNLFESKLRDRNIQEQGVVSVGGIDIAGIGGVFRGKVWNGQDMHDSTAVQSPEKMLQTYGIGNRWRGGLPLRHRSSIFPSMVAHYDGMKVDVLVTHEAPSLNRQGNIAFTRLAHDLGVRFAAHGHHHAMIEYPGTPWMGVALCGIVALDTETFETRIVDPGLTRSREDRENGKA